MSEDKSDAWVKALTAGGMRAEVAKALTELTVGELRKACDLLGDHARKMASQDINIQDEADAELMQRARETESPSLIRLAEAVVKSSYDS